MGCGWVWVWVESSYLQYRVSTPTALCMTTGYGRWMAIVSSRFVLSHPSYTHAYIHGPSYYSCSDYS